MGRWYLVRHGETAWNATGKVQGHTDVELSGQGRLQARKLATRLNDVSFHAAYSSDLSRAIETAGLLLEGRGLSAEPLAQLREAAYGEWEGLTPEEISQRYPAEYQRYMARSTETGAPSGETVQDVSRRAHEAIGILRRRHALTDDLLIVGHSGSLRALLHALVGLPLTMFWSFRVAPCSLSVVTVHEETATVDLWNDTSHLNDVLPANGA